MDLDHDIWRSATELIRQRGDGAWMYAARRHLGHRQQDDIEGMVLWGRIARAIDQRTNKQQGELQN